MNNNLLHFMRRAIEVGDQSKPEDEGVHPKVGAILVKDDAIIGTAFRGELGIGDHAEYTLLQKKLPKFDLNDTTLFTTLEPCVSRKKHKTCVEWISERGITNVVIGMLDPNPRIYSLGISQLRQKGIRVTYFSSALRGEIEVANKDFIFQFRANPKTEGIADFDYTDNDGLFTIGHGEYMFETRWSKASDTSIHVYRDNTNIAGLARAMDAHSIIDICDASVYDASSRFRTVKEGELAVFKNTNGYFAAIQVLDVKDADRSDSQDELVFQYWILTDKSSDFSNIQPN